MPLFQATVKALVSGDTLVLTNAKGQERLLSLAYVSAPRLRREGDEVGVSILAARSILIKISSLLRFNPESTYESCYLERLSSSKSFTLYQARIENMVESEYRMAPSCPMLQSPKVGSRCGRKQARRKSLKRASHT